ncbi:MAG: UDP-N-acetyl-D-glucosamine dehydrogenase, partial [Deltaproteobacteria bacterium]|nr:UDP-N-acetyl-D-glucosamine dehydrogenase [Deltaproteobacteria bacterium]
MSQPSFRKRVESGLTVGVIGLGYVGLPLVITFGRRHRVVGFDIDASKVEALRRGQSYIRSVPAEPIAALVHDRRFEPTTDFARARECD